MRTNITLSQHDIDNAVRLESLLIDALQIDVNNSEHSVRMLHKERCMQALAECVLPKYCEFIYDEVIFPVWVEIEWSNNFLSLSSMLEYVECLGMFDNEQELLDCIWKGKEMLKLLRDNRL